MPSFSSLSSSGLSNVNHHSVLNNFSNKENKNPNEIEKEFNSGHLVSFSSVSETSTNSIKSDDSQTKMKWLKQLFEIFSKPLKFLNMKCFYTARKLFAHLMLFMSCCKHLLTRLKIRLSHNMDEMQMSLIEYL